MKKLLAIALLALTCVAVLCACTPTGEKFKEKYEKEGYTVVLKNGGETEDEKIEYVLSATKITSLQNVTITCYVNGDDADKAYEEAQKLVVTGFAVKKIGNAVIYGTEDAVKIA